MYWFADSYPSEKNLDNVLSHCILMKDDEILEIPMRNNIMKMCIPLHSLLNGSSDESQMNFFISK